MTRPATGNYPNVHFETIGFDEYLLAVPENHPIAQSDVVDLADLKNEKFIIHEQNQAVSGLCLRACAAAGFEPNIICRIDAATISLNLVRSGMGLAFFCSEEMDFYHMSGVKKVRLKNPIRKEIVMAISTKHKSSLTALFSDYSRRHIMGLKQGR